MLVLDFVILYLMCKNLGERMRTRNRKPFWFQVMLVTFWFAGEIGGGTLGFIFEVICSGRAHVEPTSAILGALVGAVLGGVASFFVVHVILERQPAPGFPVLPAQELVPR